MKVYSIPTGNFKLDGGAMFGVVPKSIWNKLNPADENNMCNWAMRCLLVHDGNRLILIDNGIGDKQDAKFMGYYYLNGDDTLDKSLAALGFHRNDITDVLLTHLHFDHCGGSIRWKADRSGFEAAFPNARYWSHKEHWSHANAPNPREKASFLKENILPIQETGQLTLLEGKRPELFPGFQLRVVSGHTEAMMLPTLEVNGRTVVFMADLIPSLGHIPVNYVMAYDIRPLDSMTEREAFLKEAVAGNWILFLEHDPLNEACTVQLTERGYRASETAQLKEFLG